MQLVVKTNIYDLIPDDSKLIFYHPVPEEESWRIPILNELIDERSWKVTIEGFSIEELDDLIDLICTS